MNDIERMAREAGFTKQRFGSDGLWIANTTDLTRFAALVAVAEREACAALADAERSNTNVLLSSPLQSAAAYKIGIAIRALDHKV